MLYKFQQNNPQDGLPMVEIVHFDAVEYPGTLSIPITKAVSLNLLSLLIYPKRLQSGDSLISVTFSHHELSVYGVIHCNKPSFSLVS